MPVAPGYRLSLPLRHTVISITTPPQGTERREVRVEGREETSIFLSQLWGKDSFCKERGNLQKTLQTPSFSCRQQSGTPLHWMEPDECLLLCVLVFFPPFWAPWGLFIILPNGAPKSLQRPPYLLLLISLRVETLQQHTRSHSSLQVGFCIL